MTVKELKQKLENAPDNMDVMIYQGDDEFAYNMANSAEIRKVKFYVDPDDSENTEYAEEDCFVITDEY